MLEFSKLSSMSSPRKFQSLIELSYWSIQMVDLQIYMNDEIKNDQI